MDSTKQSRIREALRQLAAAHATAMKQMEQAMELLAAELWPEEDIPGKGKKYESPLEVDRSVLCVRYHGRSCFLGNTLMFRLIEQLARRRNKYLPYEDLLSEVWESERSDGAVRSVVKRLREALRIQGLEDVARGIDGSVPGHYALKLSER